MADEVRKYLYQPKKNFFGVKFYYLQEYPYTEMEEHIQVIGKDGWNVYFRSDVKTDRADYVQIFFKRE